MTDPFATSDAAYVLGALDEHERREFEAHLATCPACADSVAALRDLPALLDAAPADAFADDIPAEPPPDTLLPRLMREVGRQRRRRYIVQRSLAAAAAVLIATGGAVAYTEASSQSARPGTTMTKLDAEAPITGRAQVVSQGSGARIDVWCSYDASTYSTDEYELVVHSRSGKPPQVLTTWVGVPGKTIKINAPTTWPRSDISHVDIVYGSETVLTLAE